MLSIETVLLRAVFSYTNVIAKLLRRSRLNFDPFHGLSLEIVDEERSIDERLGRLETARTALQESLSAIEELKEEAEANKAQLLRTIQELEEVEKNKAAVREELEATRSVLDADVHAFRKLAGVPSKQDIFKERVIGFVSGIVASLIASFVIWIGVKAVQFVVSSL